MTHPTDPFSDNARNESDTTDNIAQSTISVGRDASLTLGTDALIILDEEAAHSDRICCGLLGSWRSLPTRSIPYYNILWAELNPHELTIHYAAHKSKATVRVESVNYSIEKTYSDQTKSWVERLLTKAYGKSQRRKRIKVLINPYGGKKGAQRSYTRSIHPIFAAARCEEDAETTKYRGHATEIAQKLDIEAYDVIACCSGDGLPHEVFNGLGRREDATKALGSVAVVQLPCGTGNAMSFNLNGTASTSLAALAVVKGIRTPMDLASITQSDRRTLSFLSQAVGIVAECDLGTEHLRWMGDARFTWGIVTRILGKTCWPADMAIGVISGDKQQIKDTYQDQAFGSSKLADTPSSSSSSSSQIGPGLPALRFGTVNDPLPTHWKPVKYPNLGNFYAGNMGLMAADANFFQAALPSDGAEDLVCIDGDLPRLQGFKFILAVANGKLFDMPDVSYQKIEGLRIAPGVRPGGDGKGYISIDGESYPFEPFQVEVHRKLGMVLSRSGRRYEIPELH